jgi:hypothetical protein
MLSPSRLENQINYETLRAALIDKWGKPDKTSVEELQNRMGAKFNRVTDQWIKQDGIVIYVLSPSGGEDSVLYQISSKEILQKEINELRDEKSGVRKGL